MLNLNKMQNKTLVLRALKALFLEKKVYFEFHSKAKKKKEKQNPDELNMLFV